MLYIVSQTLRDQLLKFESQLPCVQAVCLWTNSTLFVPQFPHLSNEDNDSTRLIVILRIKWDNMFLALILILTKHSSYTCYILLHTTIIIALYCTTVLVSGIYVCGIWYLPMLKWYVYTADLSHWTLVQGHSRAICIPECLKQRPNAGQRAP